MTQQVGVQGVFDVSNFAKGVNSYIIGMLDVEKTTRQAALDMEASFNLLSSSLSSNINRMTAQLGSFNAQVQRTASSVNQIVLPSVPTQANPAQPGPVQQSARALGNPSAILASISKENADFLKRLEKAKVDAIADIQAAVNKAGGRALKPSEFNQLRNQLKAVQLEITRDFQQTVNTMRSVGAGQGLTANINSQIINTRNVVQQSVQEMNNALSNLTGSTNKAGNALTNFASNYLKKILTFQVITGALDIVTGAVNRLTAAAREGVNSVVFFERLSFALQTNIATEIREAADYTIDMDTAIKQAEKSSDGLLRRLEKIAILSQFTFRDVAEAVKVANAYGFTADQVLRLTQNLVDLGAARGLEPQQLQLVSRALAQIITKGKLYQQEINQLGENGINIVAILKEEIGLTDEAIAQAQRANEPIADSVQAVEALLSYVEKNFAGTGERVAFSLAGLLSTLDEVRQLTSREFFGGVLRGVEPLLKGLAQFATTDEFRANLQIFGELVAKVVTGSINLLSSAIAYLRGLWEGLDDRTKTVIKTIFQAVVAANTLRFAIIGVLAVVGLLSAAFAVLQSPVIAATTAIVFLATQWAYNFDRILDLIGYLGSKIGEFSSNVIIFFSSVVEAVTRFGDQVGRVFVSIAEGFGRVLQFVVDSGSGFATVFATIASNAIDWGINIVEALAEGIGSAVDYVLEALSVIGEAITYLLIPGSPPRLLPNLDKWGTEAAEVYLDGWTQADFSVLDKIGNQFRSFFSALAQQGRVDEVNIPKMVIGAKEAVAQAIAELRKFGSVTQETLANIGEVGGKFGEILTGYVTRYAKLALATDAAVAAQEKLNNITKQYDAILKPLQRQLSVIQDKRQTAEEEKKIRQLQNVINSRYVSEARRTQAQLELDELLINQKIRGTQLEKDLASDTAQAEVDATKEVQDALQKEFDLFEARVNQQLNINQLLGEQKALLDRLASDSLKKAKEEMDKQLKAIQLQRDEMNDLIRLAEIRYRLENDSLTAAEKQLLLLEEQQIQLERINRAKEAAELGVDLTALQNVPIVPEDFLSKSELKQIDKDIGSIGGKLQGIKDLNLAGEFDKFEQVVEKQRAKWAEWGQVIEEVVNKYRNAFGFGKPDSVTTPVDAAFGQFQTTIIAEQASIGEKIGRAFWDGFAKGFKEEALSSQAQATALIETALGVNIEGESNPAKRAGLKIANGLELSFREQMAAHTGPGIFEAIKIALGVEADSSATFKDKIGIPMGNGIVAGLDEAATKNNTPTLNKIIAFFVNLFRAAYRISSPSKEFDEKVGQPIGEGIIQGIGTAITNGLSTLQTTLTTLKNSVLGFFGFGEEDSSEEELNALTEQKATALALITALQEDSGAIFTLMRTDIEAMFTLLKDNLVSETGIITLMAATIIEKVADINLDWLRITLSQNSAVLAQYQFLNTDMVGEEGVITSLKNTFIQLFTDMSSKAIEIIVNFIEELMALLAGEEGLLFRIQTEFVDKGIDLGEDFAEGIAEGIINKIDSVTDAAVKVVSDAVSAAKAELETGSPSRRAARELGEPYTEGIAQGIFARMSALTAATGAIVGSLFGFADVVEQRMGLTPTSSSITNSSTRVNNFNLNVATQQSQGNVVKDFGTMRAFAGS